MLQVFIDVVDCSLMGEITLSLEKSFEQVVSQDRFWLKIFPGLQKSRIILKSLIRRHRAPKRAKRAQVSQAPDLSFKDRARF